MGRLYLAFVPFVHYVSRQGNPVFQTSAVQNGYTLGTKVFHASEAGFDYCRRIFFTLKPDGEYAFRLCVVRRRWLRVRLYGLHVGNIAVKISVHSLPDDFSFFSAADIVPFPEAVEQVSLKEYFHSGKYPSAKARPYLHSEDIDEFFPRFFLTVD